MNRQSFHFPMQSSYFNPTLSTDSMILEQIESSLIYPSQPLHTMRTNIMLEQGMLKYNKDWSGWSKLT